MQRLDQREGMLQWLFTVNRNLCLLLLFLLINSKVYSQDKKVQELEKIVSSAIQKAYGASVRIYGLDTLRNVQNSSQFSGVVVNAEGYILTVAHAIQAGRVYKVRFPDGKEVMGKALGRMGLKNMQNRPDLGMIKITEKGTWSFAEIGWSYSMRENEPCIGISYPENLNQLKPFVRFGRISNVQDRWGFVVSTCKMEPGDSGGPLFDYMGRVIALHSRCDTSEELNYEIPVDLYRKHWNSLTLVEDYAEIPLKTDEVGTDPSAGKILSDPALAKMTFWFSGIPPIASMPVVQLKSLVEGIERPILATVVNAKGKSYLISKSSCVGSKSSFFNDGKEIELSVLKRDVTRDLVLLVSKSYLKGGITLKLFTETSNLATADLGMFLRSVLPAEERISVLGSSAFSLPRKFSAGYLGATATFRNGNIVLAKIVEGSPAELSKLQVGDHITHINGVNITKPEHYGIELVKYNPGDTVRIEGLREGEKLTIPVVLAHRAPGTHIADKYEGGRSIRCDGFDNVLTHDATLKPEECGGPVMDRKGNFRGINIARFSRTSTLIMPASEILSFLQNIK